MPVEPGQAIGDYEILSVLGSGGMGRVYKVRSLITQREEAMKVLLADVAAEEELGERFIREIRISAALDHPNIACLRAGQRVGNQLLMIMEFVHGSTLADLMREGPIPTSRSLDYISQALSALEYAHGQNVVHRDIKPSNIMITPAHQVKLMDFGVARLTTEAKLTRTGFLVGSLFYMSPEQIENAAPDARSDIYSIGVTLYELVTGKRPFDGPSDYQIMAAHLRGTPVPPRELDTTVPVAINDIILTALARDPAHRFASAKAMKAAINSVVRGSSAQTAPLAARSGNAGSVGPNQPALSRRPAAVRAAKNHRTAYMVVGSVVTLTMLVGAAIEIPNLQHTKADEPARTAIVRREASSPKTASSPVVAAPPESVADVPDAPVAITTASRQPALRSKVRQIPVSVHATTDDDRSSRHVQVQPSPYVPETNPTTLSQGQPKADATAVDTKAQLEALHERWDQLDARATAVYGSLDQLKRAQLQSGFGLRGDIAASEKHLSVLMSNANASLQQTDPTAAAKHLDGAEQELEKLEQFLGR